MFTPAAQRTESSQQQQGNQGSSSSGATAAAGGVRWSTADDRALEEAVVKARMELLFVGVKAQECFQYMFILFVHPRGNSVHWPTFKLMFIPCALRE